MSGRKKIAGDNLGRAELHSVLFDLRAWLVKTENDYRFKARRRAKAGDRDGRTEAWEQADGLAQCRAKLDDLRHRYESGAAKPTDQASPAVAEEPEPDECLDEPSVYLPTPDEITAKLAEIRSGWSDEEHQRRHFLKNDETDFGKPTNFIF